MDTLSCQTLNLRDDARETVAVSESTSDLKLSHEIDEWTKEVALNYGGAFEVLEESCATNESLTSMAG